MENNESKKITGGRKKGLVTSDSMDKTVVVSVSRFETHPKYGKKIQITKKYKAHNPENKAKKGDKVEIESCRPLSGGKRYKIIMN